MNSVFSAFKSNKSNPLNPTEKRNQNGNKKTLNLSESNNYEKLRHIREKMSNHIIDDDEINLKKRPPIPPIASYDECDRITPFKTNLSSSPSSASLSTLTTSTTKHSDEDDNPTNYSSENNLSSKCCNGVVEDVTVDIETNSKNDVVSPPDNIITSKITATATNSIKSKLLNNDASSKSTSNISIEQQPPVNNFSNTYRNRLRLSLSNGSTTNNGSASSSINHPAVHGRNSANGQPSTGRTRLSTHQRNLSLDFRSMGILLPPVSQVTSSRINMTQHHRNRSLDSALQRIPEVEVSSPNAESENSLAVCNGKDATTNNNNNTSSSSSPCSNIEVKSTEACKDVKPIKNSLVVEQDSTTSAAQSESNESNKETTKKIENLIVEKTIKRKAGQNDNKKREDLTSLGSDDSGILCGSEPDQQSLNNRRSHESLDSGENEQSENEECIDLLETTSMDEEYKALQSDLCFYQSNKEEINKKSEACSPSEEQLDAINDKKIRYRELNMNKAAILKEKYNQTICVPIEYEKDEEDEEKNEEEITEEKEKLEQIKDDIKEPQVKDPAMFKSFFFKNAIFRTAQSIIENHERKNASKPPTTPGESSKKRGDFCLKSKLKMTTSASAEIHPTVIEKPKITKSSSTTTMKVPGTAQCMVKEPIQQQIQTERGQSGLLRFFESPVFNIHFAIHYLFYSKEPGVLSFIGNKIFSFPHADVDLYIPQLILMYIQIDELSDILDPYLVYRCRQSVDFSLKCCWLLEAYNFNIENQQKFKNLYLMREIYPKRERRVRGGINDIPPSSSSSPYSPFKKTHHRSQSDATGMMQIFAKKPQAPLMHKLSLGDLSSGRAFDNGCSCFESQRGTVNDLLGQQTLCSCGAPKLASEKEFMKALIDIGKMLTSLPTKTEKTSRLRVLLNLINKNLPARVWLPLDTENPHHVVRITEDKTAVLNSKDKSPYIIYVEVVDVADIYTSPVIPKMMPTLRHTRSDEHLEQLGEPELVKKSESDMNMKKHLPSSNSHLEVFNEEDVWSQEDDEITAQYLRMHKKVDRDTVSQFSIESCDSTVREAGNNNLFNISDVRMRHCKNLNFESAKPFMNDPDDPSAAALKEPWDEKEQQIRESSPYGHLQNWRLISAIVKSGDDLRQELMATQLLSMFQQIWSEEKINLWVRPYQIVCLSNDSGLIEPILNTVSLHQIKKNSNKSLREYFIDEYDGEESDNFKLAQRNFVQSCAAYCLISYLLQVKDRHNGNILIHADGHLIHIDFGFILSISPKNLGFEQSPFKLTPEYVEVMGGPSSELFKEFKFLLLEGLKAARKQQDRIVNIVEIMRSGSQLPCFKNGCAGTVRNLRNRFHMNLTEQELEKKIDQLIQDSMNSLSTKLYDGYQYLTNGIL